MRISGLSGWLLIPLLLLNLWLTARQMVSDPIWYDEYWSLYYAGVAPEYGPASLPETWSRVAGIYHELNPPGYYLLLNVWAQIAGGTPFAARMLSAFAGLLAAAWVYRMGRDLSGRMAGLAAAAALTTSAYNIYYMHEIRAYALIPLLVLMCLWAYWQFLQRGRWQHAALLLLSLTALLYTHYMSAPFLLAAGLYHLLLAQKNRRWLLALVPVAGAGLLFLPWLAVALSALSFVSTDPARAFFAEDPLSLIKETLLAFGNGSAALLAVFGWYALRRHGARLVIFLGAVTLAGILLANIRFQFISGPRYLLALLPFIMLLIGLGAARMSSLKLRPVVLLIVWGLAGGWLVLQPDGGRRPDEWQVTLDWESFAGALRPYAQPGSTAIYLLPAPVPHWIHAPVAAYYLHDLPAVVQPMPPFVVPPRDVPAQQALNLHLIESLADKTPAAYEREARDLLDGLNYVWIAYNPTHLPAPFTRPALDSVLNEQGFVTCEQIAATPELSLTLLARLPEPEGALVFGDTISLNLLTPLPEPVRDPLFLILSWTLGDAVPRGTYSVALHVENSQDQLVAQKDAGLPDAGRACQPVSVPLGDLPPGQYTLRAAVYNWQTGERLPSGTEERPIIGRFTIGD